MNFFYNINSTTAAQLLAVSNIGQLNYLSVGTLRLADHERYERTF